MKASERKELEAMGEAFIARVEGPHAPEAFNEFGAQRVWSKAQSLKASGARIRAGRVNHNPALLRYVTVTCLALILLMTVSTTGAYALSLQAQPDSNLYGVKIFFERARLAFTISSLEDARLEMDYSLRRMEELENLVSRGNGRGAERWLKEYLRNLEGAGAFLESTFSEEASSLSLRFQEMLDAQAGRMESMRDGEPAPLAESIDAAYHACNRERERMRRRCGMDGEENDAAKGEQGGGGQGGNGQGGPGCSSESEDSIPPGPGSGACPQQDGNGSTVVTAGGSTAESGGSTQPQYGEQPHRDPYSGGDKDGPYIDEGREGEGSTAYRSPYQGRHLP